MPYFPEGEMTIEREMAQSSILYGVREDLTGGEIIAALQKSDMWYRATDFGKDLAYWRGAVEAGKKMKYTWGGEVVNPDLYLQTGWHMAGRFETVMYVEWHDPITGEGHKSHVTVVHTHFEEGLESPDLIQEKTRAELEDAAAEMVQGESPGGDVVVDYIAPVMGFYNPEVGLWG